MSTPKTIQSYSYASTMIKNLMKFDPNQLDLREGEIANLIDRSIAEDTSRVKIIFLRKITLNVSLVEVGEIVFQLRIQRLTVISKLIIMLSSK